MEITIKLRFIKPSLKRNFSHGRMKTIFHSHAALVRPPPVTLPYTFARSTVIPLHSQAVKAKAPKAESKKKAEPSSKGKGKGKKSK